MQDNIFELLKSYSKEQLRELMSSRGIIFKDFKYHCRSYKPIKSYKKI